MSSQLDLKEIERKAFRSTHQDGLWDMYFGLVIICVGVFTYRPPEGYSPLNLVLTLTALCLAYGLFWAGKKFITVPRLGQVRFGDARKKRGRSLAIILSAVVLVQLAVLLFTVGGWLNEDFAAKLNRFLSTKNGLMDLTVAIIGSLFVGPSMILMAYFNDFPRGYYIAIMTALAVFLMIWLNNLLYPLMIGLLVALPGLVLFVIFLRKYPHQQEDKHNG